MWLLCFAGCLAQLGVSSNVNANLYKAIESNGSSVNPTYFTDVVTGTNDTAKNISNAYNAASGFDLCSGLGTPIGTNFLSLLK